MGSTGIVSVLFTDLVGSTEIATRLGEPGADALRLTHFEVLREALRRSAGTEVKNLGDGLMVVFAAASESAAVAMQQGILQPAPGYLQIHLSRR